MERSVFIEKLKLYLKWFINNAEEFIFEGENESWDAFEIKSLVEDWKKYIIVEVDWSQVQLETTYPNALIWDCLSECLYDI